MPRYFFHVESGPGRLVDHEGIELPDAEAAWYQAYRSAFDHIAPAAAGPERRLLQVEDEAGAPVLAVALAELIAIAA